jgi:LPS-assembly protein
LHLGKIGWFLLSFLVVAGPALPSVAEAQTLNERLAAKAQPGGNDKLLVDAREIVYDNDHNTVSAVGEVQLYYQGRVLQADKVTYDRNTNRVLAEGNARLTETDGTVATGDRFELTDDFKDGFIDSLRIETADKTRFSAPRAERTGGESTVFEKGTYTACEACKKDPSRPPLWQVKAAKIIHNNSERMIYYEDATIEFYGIPLAYIPYFSAPDPTVKRKTGFLAPHYIYSSALGYGASTPFFWAIAPDYDLTLTPTYLTNQGFLGQAEWRQRFLTGSYNIRVAGIRQQHPYDNAFLLPPYGPRGKDFRGSIESTGRFNINTQWAWGWDIALMTDKWFFTNYKIHSESLTSTFFNESTSTAYLTGRSDTGFFDARGYYFRTLSANDWQKQQPVVYPTIDYNKRIQAPGRIGGEIAIDANITHLSRSAAQYQQIPGTTTYFPVGSPYGTCAIFNTAQCLVRGIGGDYTRLSVGVTWQREFTDSLGQIWKPFAGLRVDGFSTQLSTTGYQNAEIGNFLNPDDNIAARFMPTVGLEYRYPFVATSSFGTHIIEPIAQIVVRPNETRIGQLPDEDSQSLVFDDTNLFEWNKFSGYDRVEGGVRANVGAKYSLTTDSGGYGDVLFGQSYQLAGRNSYAGGDIAHVGLDSGLEQDRSDFVGRVHYAPSDAFSFTGRGRFDNDTFAMERLELQSKARITSRLSASALYARYAAQPELGYPTRREGLLTSANFKLTDRWSLNGSVLFDLDRYLSDRQTYVYAGLPAQQSNRWSIASMSVGALYQDECTTFGVTYVSSFKDDSTGTRRPDTAIMLRLELRTLGEVNYSYNLDTASSTDGISN